MADIARANHIPVVFASLLPPPHDLTPQAGFHLAKHSPEDVGALNTWLKAYCLRHHLSFIDYESAMRGHDGHINPELAEDGIHPNEKGYQIMAPLAEAGLKAVVRPAAGPEKPAQQAVVLDPGTSSVGSKETRARAPRKGGWNALAYAVKDRQFHSELWTTSEP